MLLLVSFPVVAAGQEFVSQIQINAAAHDFPQFRLATFRQTTVSVSVMRMSEKETGQRLRNEDIGGVNPIRIPEPSIHPLHAFSSNALIGPVWNHGVAGTQFWDRLGMVNPAQNPITILEGISKDVVIFIGQQCTSDVTVGITGHAGTNLTVSLGTFTFMSGDWTDQTATLTAGHDIDAISGELPLTITATQGCNESSVQRAATIVDDEIIWELAPGIVREIAVCPSTRMKTTQSAARNANPSRTGQIYDRTKGLKLCHF